MNSTSRFLAIICSMLLLIGCKEEACKNKDGSQTDAQCSSDNSPQEDLGTILQANLRFWKMSSDGGARGQTEDGFGNTNGQGIAIIGDINHDGYDDLAIGSPWGGNPQAQLKGRVYVISGLDGSSLLNLEGEFAGDHFGYNVAAAGDVNGDGTPDILVSATARSKAFLFSGADGSLLWSKQLSQWWNSCYGYQISSSGDFDSDGYGDFAIADPCADGHQGRVYFYSGHYLGNTHILNGSQPNDEFGFRMAKIGNNLAITNRAQGIVSIYQTVSNYSTLLFSLTGSTYNMGSAVADTGDLNNDGISDIIVSNFDQTMVFSGGDGSLLFAPNTLPSVNPLIGNYTSEAVAGVGDWNNDGQNDYAVVWGDGHIRIYSGLDGSDIGTIQKESMAGGLSLLAGKPGMNGSTKGSLFLANSSTDPTYSGPLPNYQYMGGKVYFYEAQ